MRDFNRKGKPKLETYHTPNPHTIHNRHRRQRRNKTTHDKPCKKTGRRDTFKTLEPFLVPEQPLLSLVIHFEGRPLQSTDTRHPLRATTTAYSLLVEPQLISGSLPFNSCRCKRSLSVTRTYTPPPRTLCSTHNTSSLKLRYKNAYRLHRQEGPKI